MPYRTGAERTIGKRADNLYAFKAKQKGKVIKVEDDLMVLEYEDGTTDSVQLGTIHGNVPGSAMPHEIITDMKVGDKVKPNDIVSWADGWFVRDGYDKTNVSFVTSTLARVALIDDRETDEDGCVISKSMADKLETRVSHKRDIVFEYDKDVSELVKVGDTVESDDILCIIQDQIGSELSGGDKEAFESISRASAQTPKANYDGTVTHVEVLYYGDTTEASDSIKKIIAADNKRRAKIVSNGGSGSKTGELKDAILVDKNRIVPGTVVIRVYIDGDLDMATGDKLVVSHQLKSTVSRVDSEEMYGAEDDLPIDVKFGVTATFNRVVTSAIKMGLINKIMKNASLEFAKIYREG